jgi:hypothetical protein
VRRSHGPWLFFEEQFVHQDPSVVADYLTADASVVIFVLDAPASAPVISFLGEYRLLVLILVAVSVHDPPARCLLTTEMIARDRHAFLLAILLAKRLRG